MFECYFKSGRRTWVLCLVLVFSGCARKASVTGTVTYEGQPVRGGGIVFASADGGDLDKNIGRAAIDSDGKYTVTNMPPGKKRLQIAALRAMLPPSEASERLPPPVPEFPDDAEGNGQLVDLNPGQNKLDIALTKPTGKKK